MKLANFKGSELFIVTEFFRSMPYHVCFMHRSCLFKVIANDITQEGELCLCQTSDNSLTTSINITVDSRF